MAKKKINNDPILQLLLELGIPQTVLEYSDRPVRVCGSYSYIVGWSDEDGQRAKWWKPNHCDTVSCLNRDLVDAYVIVKWRRVKKPWPWEVSQIVVRTSFRDKSRNEIAAWLRQRLPG